MDYKKVIDSLQVELTSYCNSHCPGCARNIDGGEIHPLVNLAHMEMSTWKILINDSYFLKNCKCLAFNGMFGDPMMHPNLLEMLDHLADTSKGKISIELNSNGGIRSKFFWQELSHILQRFQEHEMIFSIDGLQDTNHIYRRGVDYNRIIENAKSFIDAGGNAMWKMIVFDHNKHQISEAKDIARKMEFASFKLNSSTSKNYKAIEYKSFPSWIITAPENNEVIDLQNKYDEVFDKTTTELPSDNTNLHICQWINMRSLQITLDGKIWPCCYTAENPYNKNDPDQIWTFDHLDQIYSEGFNNINQSSLEQIIDHRLFVTDIEKIWSSKSSMICNMCIQGQNLGVWDR